MTEKRFILKSDYDWWGVIDATGEIKGEYSDCFSTDDVVDLLNEQHETIQQLRRDNQDLIAENVRLMNKLWRSDVE